MGIRFTQVATSRCACRLPKGPTCWGYLSEPYTHQERKHCLTTSMLRPDVKIVLTEHSMIESTAEWGERTRHERTSGNENQLGLATGIDYLRRQSPLCSCGITPANT